MSELDKRLRAARARLADVVQPNSAEVAGRGDPARHVSAAQQWFWLEDRIVGGSPKYNVSEAIQLTGELDIRALRTAVAAVATRHPVLRSGFVDRGGAPMPVVHEPDAVPVLLCDVRDHPDVPALVATADAEPIPLATRPPMRVHVYRIADRRWLILLTVHHIAVDAPSMSLLWAEMADQYRRVSAGGPPLLKRPRVCYADVAAAAAAPSPDDVDYWKRTLTGAPDLELPLDRPRGTPGERPGAQLPITVPAPLAARIRRCASRCGATEFMVHTAAFSALLAMLSGQRDVVVGTPVLGRAGSELQDVIGPFLNVLALRIDLSGEPDFIELIRRTRRTALEGFSRGQVPFAEVVKQVGAQKARNRNPLFETMITVEQGEPPLPRWPGAIVARVPIPTSHAKFDLEMMLTTGLPDGSVQGVVAYATDVLDAATADKVAELYIRLLDTVTQRPYEPVTGATLLGPHDPPVFTGPERAVGASLLQRIVEQAGRTPDAPAVGDRTRVLTYAELLATAAGIAGQLREAGVCRDDTVGVCLERTPQMVATLLGVWLAGAAYLPLDPSYGEKRIGYMLRRSSTSVVLTDGTTGQLLDWNAAGTRSLPVTGARAAVVENGMVDPEGLAYVIYTSGSTGRPRGVMVRHAGLAGFAVDWIERLGIDPTDTVAATTTISFDMAVLELLVPLAVGARVELIDRDTVIDGHRLAEVIETAGVTVMQATPAGWSLLIGSGWSGAPLRALSGGEALPAALARDIAARTERLWNAYGPTETTIGASAYLVPTDTEIAPALGEPLVNTTLAVLDSGGRPVAPGAAGELYIGGSRLARGYLGDPAATAARFVPDPTRPGERLYRTGDLVRRRFDGALEFLGRADNQLKIRGYRVEPEEIEARLRDHPSVADAAVHAAGQGIERVLVAYLVWRTTESDGWSRVRKALAEVLPDYMIPTMVVAMEQLPITPNGKLDRAALPAPPLPAGRPSAPPQTPLQRRVAAIWSSVLGVDGVGIDDDFFALGGHSLLAARLVAAVREQLGADVPMRQLFAHPTVAALCEFIGERPHSADHEPDLPVATGASPLSSTQQRFWFLDRLRASRTDYHVSVAVLLRGTIDPVLVHEALLTVVARHDILRTRFGDGAVQVIDPVRPLWTNVVELGRRTPVAFVDEIAAQPFDLAEGPLMRAGLARSGGDHVLALVLHHAVIDGSSMPILWREFNAAYRALAAGEPPAGRPPVQFADYARWERARTDDGRDLCYWRQRLAGASATEIPPDRPRPAVFVEDGAELRFELDAATTAAVDQLAHRGGTTPFVVLLGAFAVTVGLLAGTTDVVLGTPIAGAGRSRPEFAELIGPLLNSVVVRADVRPEHRFADLLAELHLDVADAHDHQQLPFERLVEQLDPQRDLARHPLFGTMFALDAFDESTVDLPGVIAEPLDASQVAVKLDLSMSLMRAAEHIDGALQYATSLYDPATAAVLVSMFRRVLALVVAAPDDPLGALPLAGPDDVLMPLPAEQPTRPGEPTEPETTLTELVERGIRDDAPTLTAGGQTLTGAQLRGRADALAVQLQRAGAGRGVLVGVLLPRSADLVVAMLAVLRSGSTLLTLDPLQPPTRLRRLLADVPLVVTDRPVGDPALAETVRIIEPDGPPGGVPTTRGPEPDDIAYITYTSGSTGTPKAVATRHGAAAGYLRHVIREYRLGQRDVVLQLAALSFDASVRDILSTLAAGARLVLTPDQETHDQRAIARALLDHEITALLSMVPSMLGALVTAARQLPRRPGLRLILTSGEELPAAVATAALDLGDQVEVVNQYGPTECTMTTTFHRVTEADLRAGYIPAGRPLPDARVLILDAGGRPLPRGAVGELAIGGPRVSAGYLGAPGLTALRFVPDPFQPGARLYRTGDLARVDHHGEVRYLGRLDHQVKVRGVRVEPGEIESSLLAVPGVRAAAVVVVGERDRVELVAHVVADPFDASLLRASVVETLPQSYHPSRFVRATELPRTVHGKVDRAELVRRTPPAVGPGREVLGPRDGAELRMVPVWERVLGCGPIGVCDDFFELGGHSLKAVELIDAIAETFGVELPLNAIFQHRTIEALAARTGQPAQDRLMVLLTAPDLSGTPLFLVHPQSGDACGYVALAREWGRWRPVYGIEAVGYNTDVAPLADIPAMAQRYVSEIRAVAPHGPYLLAGWSFGGNVALEMTRLLEAAGEKVAFLGVIDARAFGVDSTEHRYENVADLEKFSLSHGVRDAEISAEGQGGNADFEEVLAGLTRHLVDRARLPAGAQTPALRRMYDVFTANGHAADRFRPAEVGADIWLFKASEQHPSLSRPVVRPESWQQLTRGEIHVSLLPGNHHDLFTEPNVATVAVRLRDAVDAVLAVDSGATPGTDS
ncbi:non-ribosomal peptide synthetase [Micromonospora sp. WMMA1996]|uniref:amino acid adenylation domain-containing protein n=1 Tax=Micromonospora sp. WMMA1996 TaxID=2039878 RepID=UPI000BF731DD|nr:non-ribosomal peptide synthetase [Micromonospora sp. WMMA1996]PGH42981.1 non-ribosomal peptide synthetase [Micromonospora sp. WMMA1996]